MTKSKQSTKSDQQRKKKGIKKEVKEYLKENQGKGFNHKQLTAHLGLNTKKEKDKLLKVLEELYLDGYIKETKPGNYKHMDQKEEYTGKLDMSGKGFGFVSLSDQEEDIFIPPNKTGTALNKDWVKIKLHKGKRKGGRPEGEITEVVERYKKDFVGTLELSENFAFVVSDNPKMDVDIFVPLKNLNGGKNGQKVVAEMTDWPEDAKSPFGRVSKVLGEAGDHSTEMNAIIEEFELPTSFPDEVEKEAEQIPDLIPKAEVKKRKDLRDITTFTIDPQDAKDFDDALSIRQLENGDWEVGIHIADVTHYVEAGSALDKEAYKRATSVYLVDRVIPMLPEKLSNQLCSLRPEEDKMAFSAVFQLDDEANVKHEWFGKTLINSNKRFNYEEAQGIMDAGEGPFVEDLNNLRELATKLRKKRFDEGAISFETTEVEFEMDDNFHPVGIIKKERMDAHFLIEDFMLLANRKVAEFIFSKQESFQEMPFVYRVHESPPDDKLENFVRIARSFGYEFDTKDPETVSASFNKLLDKVEGRPEQNMLESLAIRTMSKAFYTTKQGSHYGLSFDYYTHFTSPIRRYPDVIAHRLLQHYLTDEGPAPKQDEIEEQCKHSSEMEIRAEDAERASIKYKQVEFMADHIGEEFRGLIAGVTNKAVFVEIPENKCEGKIPLENLIDDYYEFDDENYLIRGTSNGRTYQLGDEVRIRVMEANPLDRKLIFDML